MTIECRQQIFTVDYVDNSKRSTSFVSEDGYAEENRTEFIRKHW